MKKYLCEPCGYVYDPELGDPDGGIEPGTAFEDIPDDWVCPICGMGFKLSPFLQQFNHIKQRIISPVRKLSDFLVRLHKIWNHNRNQSRPIC